MHGIDCVANTECAEELSWCFCMATRFLLLLEHWIPLKHSENNLMGFFHAFYIVNKILEPQTINYHH